MALLPDLRLLERHVIQLQNRRRAGEGEVFGVGIIAEMAHHGAGLAAEVMRCADMAGGARLPPVILYPHPAARSEAHGAPRAARSSPSPITPLRSRLSLVARSHPW